MHACDRACVCVQDMTAAAQHLRHAKGLDPMVSAAKSGLPIDITKVCGSSVGWWVEEAGGGGGWRCRVWVDGAGRACGRNGNVKKVKVRLKRVMRRHPGGMN